MKKRSRVGLEARSSPTTSDRSHLTPWSSFLSADSWPPVSWLSSCSLLAPGAGNMAAPQATEARQMPDRALMAPRQPSWKMKCSTRGGSTSVPTPVPHTAMPVARARLRVK